MRQQHRKHQAQSWHSEHLLVRPGQVWQLEMVYICFNMVTKYLYLLLALASAAAIKQLKAGLLSLPKPKNDFEIILPEVEETTEDADDMQGVEEDASDRDRKLRELQAAEGT